MSQLIWKDTFSAFAGPATLDASYMVKETILDTTTNAAKDHTEADCQKFYDWIEHLRNDLKSTNAAPGLLTGIQPQFVDDVRKLINEFFPARDADNKWKPAIRIKTKNNQGYIANPESVRFGNKNPLGYIQILDAASALGYIFTVAKHPQDATWDHYYLPLSLIYCRFLYLAFVKGRLDDSTIIDTSLDVPQTSCVMYAGAGEQIRYFFGSSPARLYTPDGESQALRENSLQVLDGYRRNAILKPHLSATGSTKQIPKYSPKTLEDLAIALWDTLTYEGSILFYESKPLLTTLSAPSKLLKETYEQALKKKFDVLPLAKIRGHGHLGPQLEKQLNTLIMARFLPPGGIYDKEKPETVAAWQELLAIYLFPHMIETLPKKNWGQKPAEMPDTEITKLAIAAIETAKTKLLQPFWLASKNQLQKVLDDVFFAAQSTPPRNPFGRCAETYCVVAMLPYYSDPASMDTVRGLAFAVKPIGESDAFRTKFDSEALGKASKSSVLRTPCENCEVLLPLYGIKPAYNEDLLNILKEIKPSIT